MAGFDMSALAALTPQANSPITTNGSHDALAIMPDQAPQARFNVAAAPTGQQTTFQGGPSLDSDGSAAKWTWDFGDGTTGDGQTITHVFDHAGSFPVTLTVADDEGCSVASVYTGSALSCAGSVYARMTQVVNVVDAVPVVTPDPSCNHDGDDGFCGTPDHKAPVATVLGFNDGATISLIDAPTEIVGSITPDPSGIKTVRMRFSKANGTVFKTKTVRKKVCRTVRVKGKKRRSCKKRNVVVKTKTKVAACLTVSGSKNYLVRYQCAKVPWVSIGGESVFRYELPIALGLGTYTVTIVVTDGAGNQDVVEQGRDAVGFKVVNTPSNAGGDGSTGTGGTTTETPPPVNDTGSPFG
jgi:PKD repeat protein